MRNLYENNSVTCIVDRKELAVVCQSKHLWCHWNEKLKFYSWKFKFSSLLLTPRRIVTLPVRAGCQIHSLIVVKRGYNPVIRCSWYTTLKLIELTTNSIWTYDDMQTLKSSMIPKDFAAVLYWFLLLYWILTGPFVLTIPRRSSSNVTTGVWYTSFINVAS